MTDGIQFMTNQELRDLLALTGAAKLVLDRDVGLNDVAPEYYRIKRRFFAFSVMEEPVCSGILSSLSLEGVAVAMGRADSGQRIASVVDHSTALNVSSLPTLSAILMSNQPDGQSPLACGGLPSGDLPARPPVAEDSGQTLSPEDHVV